MRRLREGRRAGEAFSPVSEFEGVAVDQQHVDDN